MAKVILQKGKPHDYTYKFNIGRVHQVGGFIVFREPFEMVAVCDDCGHVLLEYCIGGYATVESLGGGKNGEN